MKKKKVRQKRVRRRKNFFPTLMLIILLWSGLAGVVYFIDPFTFGAIPLFLVLLFLALLFTFSMLFANTRRGAITAGALAIFALLRYLGVGNIINFLLLAGLAITLDIYFSKN